MERWAALLRNFLTAFVTWQAVTASGPGLAADRKTVDPFDCRPAAIAPSDNDIWLVRTPHLSGLPVEIPPAVLDAIHNSAARLMEETKQDGDRIEVKDCAEMFVGTYRIAVPHNRDLFVADIKMGWSNQFFYLFLYDPSTGAVTQRPRRVQSYWFEGLLERESKTLVQQPVISFVDLYQNGERQILIQERIHSGNMFPARVNRSG